MSTEAPTVVVAGTGMAALEASLADARIKLGLARSTACEGSDMPNAGEAEMHLPTAYRWNRKMPAWTHTATCPCGHCYAERMS
jgi:hypothetical protein